MPSSAPRGRRSSRADNVVQNRPQTNRQDIETSTPTEHSNKPLHASSTTTPPIQRLWPLIPTLEKLITFFPIGSLWLQRLETNETARLHFFHRLHNFYNHPLMRLSSTNKHRAQTISTYILESESKIKHNTRATDISQPEPIPANISHPEHTSTTTTTSRSRQRSTRHKHRNPRKCIATLTKQNLAVLEEAPEEMEGAEVYAPSPKSTKVYMERELSKAFKEEREEDFARKRQSHIDIEAGQLRMLAKG